MAIKKKDQGSQKPKPVATDKPSIIVSPTVRTIIYSIILGIIVWLYSFARYKLLGVPLERDEGSYGYIGQLILDGKTPYIDFYEMKLPALYYWYALMVKIGGSSIIGLHTITLVICACSSILIYLITKNMGRIEGGVIGAMAFLALSLSNLVFGFTAQAEHLINFQVILSFYFISCAYKNNQWYWWVLAGIVFTNAVFTKQIAAVFALAYLALLFIAVFHHTKEFQIKNAIKPILWSTLGSMTTAVFWFAIVGMQGAWDQMMFWVLDFPKSYTQLLTWTDRKGVFYGMLSNLYSHFSGFWIVGGIALLFGFLKSGTWLRSIFVLLMLVASIAAVFPGYYFYQHYWIILALGLGFGFSFSYGMMLDYLKLSEKSFYSLGITLFLIVILGGMDLAKHQKYYFKSNLNQLSKTTYGTNPFVESVEVANYLKKKAKPGDELIVMGSEPQINLYTGMRSPTRHFFMGFLTKGKKEEQAWIEEVKKDIETHKPRFLVQVIHPYSWTYVNGVKTDLFDFGIQYANTHYNLVGIVDLKEAGTVYAWDQEVSTYPPMQPGDFRMLVFEIK